MAIKPFDYYQRDMAKGLPGMKADATVDVVDSFAAEGGIDPGEAVIRGTDPARQVKSISATSEAASVIGIATHTHKAPHESGKYYKDGYCLPVMTFGDIYVEAAGEITAGDPVAITIDSVKGGQFVTGGASSVSGAAAVSGMTYLDSASEGDLVRVRIRK